MKNKKVTQLFAGLMVTALVMTGTVIPPTTAQAATKSVTIKTQKQLNEALKNPKVTSIVIKTAKGATFKIKNGDYGKKNLIINSPKATIDNYGSFKKISIQDGMTVYDADAKNQIAVSDKNTLKLVTGKKSYDTNVTITSKGAKISIVNNGDINAINVKGKSTVALRGNSTEAPRITNNAKDAKIITAMDANVVLNKPASLTVKSGVTLERLSTKADSNIKVAAGTTVKTLVIDGADAKVALDIDGTVEKIIVEKKADVTVGGSTTTTVAVENNASGSTITSEVKTAVSLSADAKISLEKGAEGSTVKTEKADVKADVANQTSDKVTITDSTGKDATIDSGKTSEDAKPSTGDTNKDQPSGGNTGGGSGWNGGSGNGSGNGGETEQTATISVSVSEGELKAGTELTAEATNSKGEDAVYTYEWKAGDAVVSTSDKYQIKAADVGKTLSVTATAVIGGKTITGTKSVGVVKAIYAGNSYADPGLKVANDTTAENVIAQLPAKIIINDADSVNVKEVAVTWTAPEGYDDNAATAGDYSFTGKFVLPNGWTGEVSGVSLTATVTVLDAGTLDYKVSTPTGFEHNQEYGTTKDTTAETNANQGMVKLSGTGFDYVLTGKLSALNGFKSAEASQATNAHKWIGVLIDVEKDVKDNLYFGTTESLDDQHKVTAYEDQVATKNQIIWWVKADEIAETPATRYMKYGADGKVTPITIRFENTDTEINRFEAVAPVSGGTYGTAETDILKLGLPETVKAYDTKGNPVNVKVKWTADANYKSDAGAGDYTFTSALAEDAGVVLKSGLEIPTATVTIGKAENTATCAAPTVEDSKTTENSITLNANSVNNGESFQYACSTTNAAPTDENAWKNETTFTSLTAGTTYYFFARIAASDNYKPSAASAATSAMTTKISTAEMTAMSAKIFDCYKEWEGIPDSVAKFGAVQFAPDAENATTIKVTGNLNYVEGFTGFYKAEPLQQQGYYLPLQFVAPDDMGDGVSVVCGEGDTKKTFGKSVFDEVDGKNVFSMIYITSEKTTEYPITIDWDGVGTKYAETTYTLDLSGLTKTPAVVSDEGNVTLTFPEVIGSTSDGLSNDEPKLATAESGYKLQLDTSEAGMYKLTGTITPSEIEAKMESDSKSFAFPVFVKIPETDITGFKMYYLGEVAEDYNQSNKDQWKGWLTTDANGYTYFKFGCSFAHKNNAGVWSVDAAKELRIDIYKKDHKGNDYVAKQMKFTIDASGVTIGTGEA